MMETSPSHTRYYKLAIWFLISSSIAYQLRFSLSQPYFDNQTTKMTTPNSRVQNTTMKNTKVLSYMIDSIRKEAEILLAANNSASLPMPPQKTLVAFIHVGKTGGSSLSTILRNGCHSMKAKPCKSTVPSAYQKSAMSKLSTYYHIPDFENNLLFDNLKQKDQHRIVAITLRDPFDRIVSAFVFHHPKNHLLQAFEHFKVTTSYNERLKELGSEQAVFQFREQKVKQTKEFQQLKTMYECFPTLEAFSTLLDESSNDSEKEVDLTKTPGNHSNFTRTPVTLDTSKNLSDCKMAAKLAIGQHPWMGIELDHFRWGLLSLVKSGSIDQYPILVMRREHLKDDWVSVNKFFEPQKSVLQPPTQVRNFSKLILPVTKELSLEGQKAICQALEEEYKVYFQLLDRALNIHEEEKIESIRYSKNRCPSLNFPE